MGHVPFHSQQKAAGERERANILKIEWFKLFTNLGRQTICYNVRLLAHFGNYTLVSVAPSKPQVVKTKTITTTTAPAKSVNSCYGDCHAYLTIYLDIARFGEHLLRLLLARSFYPFHVPPLCVCLFLNRVQRFLF